MTTEIKFPNWQSRVFLSAVSRRQPICPAALPRGLVRSLQWYEKRVLKVDEGTGAVDRPILLLGMPRSGTTMLQDLLCSHPQVAYINNTMNLFPDCFCAIEHWRQKLRLDFEGDRYLSDSVSVSASSPSDAVAMWGTWFKLDVYDLRYCPRTMADFPPPAIDEIHSLLRRVLWCYHGERTRFFNKLLAVMPYIHLVRQIFPGARFVHIIRDARNTANSMLKLCRTEIEHQKQMGLGRRDPVKGVQYFISYPRFEKLSEYVAEFGLDDIRTTAHLWNDEMTYIDSIRGEIPHFYEVRYEDIVASPEREIAKLLEFCELSPLDGTCGALRKKIADVGVLRHSNRYGEFPVVEKICGENLRKHGYPAG